MDNVSRAILVMVEEIRDIKQIMNQQSVDIAKLLEEVRKLKDGEQG